MRSFSESSWFNPWFFSLGYDDTVRGYGCVLEEPVLTFWWPTLANFKQSVPPCLIMCRSQAFVSCVRRNGTEYSYYLLSYCAVPAATVSSHMIRRCRIRYSTSSSRTGDPWVAVSASRIFRHSLVSIWHWRLFAIRYRPEEWGVSTSPLSQPSNLVWKNPYSWWLSSHPSISKPKRVVTDGVIYIALLCWR